MRQTTQTQFRRLNYAIIAMLALSFVFGTVTLVIHVWIDSLEDEKILREQNDRLARSLAAYAASTITEIDDLLRHTSAGLPEDWLTNPAATRAALQRNHALSSSVRNLAVLDRDGTIVADALGRVGSGTSAKDRTYFRVHLASITDSLYVAPRLTSRFGDGPVQVLSRPLRDSHGSLLGVITAAIDLSYFLVLEDGFDLAGGGRIALLGPDGSIRYIDSGAPALLGGRASDIVPMLGYSGIQRLRSSALFDGVLRDYSLYPLPHNALTLVVGLPPHGWQTVLVDSIYSTVPGLTLMIGLVVAMGLTFSWHLRRSQSAIVAAESRERQFSDVAHAVPGTLYQWRRLGPGRGYFTWLSPNSIETLGLEPDEVLRRQKAFCIHPDDYQRWLDSMEEAAASGSTWNYEGRFILHDGREKRLHTVAGAFLDADGKLVHNGVMIDVTEERRRAVSMANTEGRLEMLLDAARDAIISLDDNLHITHFNKGAEQLFGRSAGDMIGGTLDPLLPADFHDRHDTLMRGMLAGPDGSREMSSWRRVNGVRADGSVFPLLASISKITVLGRPMLCAIMRDMSEEAASEQQLTQLAEERQKLLVLAEQASEAKSKFLAVMSHELRTPLNAIIGFSELIQQKVLGPISPPKYADYVEDILLSGRHLLAIINDILDLTKLQEQGGDFRFAPQDPVGAVEDAMTFIKARIVEKNIAMTVTDQAAGAMVLADERALRQMLINLLGNAVKFTPPEGCVSLLVRHKPESGRVVIEVLDTGPGVSAALLARLGKPFVQDRDSYTADNPGTGLGLAIVVEMAAAHHGSVSFRNRPEGGFCTALELPVAVSAAQAA